MRALDKRPISSTWGCAAVFLATLAAYGPALHGRLLWNDSDYVTQPALRSLAGLRRIWFEVGATEQYYPVLHSAFWAEHRLWGDATLGYHLANILLHALAACLFAFVLRKLSVPAPWLGALLFALHPVAVESVAWISEQKNTLSLVFYLLAALAYLRFDETRRRRFYFAGLACFVLALLSKSVTATLPAALLVAFWWRRGRISWRRDVWPLLPWFGTGAAVGLFTAWVEHTYIGAEGPAFALGGMARGLVAGRAIWFYLGKLAWPVDLIFIYPRWHPNPASGWQWLFLLGAVALAAALWLRRRQSRAPLAAFLFFVGSLFPTLGFFNVYAFVFSFVADHWQYLASLGVFALAAGAWGRWAAARPGAKLPGLAAAVVLGALGTLTWRQARAYRDVETLYRFTLDRNPRAWLAHTNLGNMLASDGRTTEAIEQYRAALETVPEYPEIHCNLANALVQAGRTDEAVAEYREALRLNPAYAAAALNLAHTLVRRGHPAEAVPYYQRALRLKPGNADWEVDFGVALARSGHPQEAAAHDETALQLRPAFPEAHNNLGEALADLGQLPEAAAQYEAALALRPRYPEAEYGLANTLGNLGHMDEAIEHYRAALALRPDYAEAHANLGLALANVGSLPEAVDQLGQALRVRPDYAEARAYLGFVFAQSGRPLEAVEQYREALRLNPRASDVHYQLGRVLEALGRTQEAAGEFEAAKAAPQSPISEP